MSTIMVGQPLNSGGVRAILAYVITETLGSDWHESQKLAEFSEQAPSVTEQLLHELGKINSETVAECTRAARLFPIEPTTYKHQLREFYTEFLDEAKRMGQFENPATMTTFIAFIVEVCRRCIEEGQSKEVLPIYEYSCRLMSESSTTGIPNSWEQYIDSLCASSSDYSRTRRQLLWDALLVILRTYENYNLYTN